MAILYSLDGEPRQIPDSLVDRFLSDGYRRTPPGAKPTIAQPSTIDEVTSASDSSIVAINTASLKELIALPLVGTSIAKKIIAQRPYSSIEELIEKIEGVEWIAIQAQISF